ncbi:hypothetical protein FHX37_3922 [Haloactinospora alba]|uniref:Secreted protein n=1 Tax=Haloactinospora alba TaxID=405555 RepID=A0A543N9P8_9ACTN|nr:DUF6049 family protein [Haloactinospora alba]TQN28574.1 hypothetical protein FHX37_3922 [Haloactinospora alba]
MRRFVHLIAVTTTAAFALAPLSAPSAAPLADTAPAAADNTDGSGAVLVDEISPRAVGADDTLTLSGRVTNTTDSELTDASVRLRYTEVPFEQRSELDTYDDGESDPPEQTHGETPIDTELEAGESATYELEVDVADLDLGGAGVYPIAVEARTGSGTELGSQRTFLPYQDDSSPEPADIAWVWPLAGGPHRTDDDTYLHRDFPQSLTADGRLGTLLSAGAQEGGLPLAPEVDDTAPPQEESASPTDDDADDGAEGDADSGVPVTWAVDPALLDDVNRLTEDSYEVLAEPLADVEGEDPETTEHDSSGAAQVWLEQARDALGDETLVSTPYASPDIPALLANGREEDAEAAMTLSEQKLADILGRAADSSVAWPADGHMDTAARDFYNEHGATRFVLDSSAMPPHPWAEESAPAAAPLSLPESEEDGTALLADSQLTDALAQHGRGPGQAALGTQRFAAETAMLSAAGDGDSDSGGSIVAVPPRDWNPDPAFARNVLRDSDDLPWLEPAALEDVRSGSTDEPQRQELSYPARGTPEQLSGSYLDGSGDLREEVRLFNSILVKDEEGSIEDNDPYRPALLRLSSAAWREEEKLASTARDLVDYSVRESLNQVRIIPTEPVTLAAQRGKIGIPLANDLQDHTVRVDLTMFSENNEQLSVGDYPSPIELGPETKTTVYVPLEARVNGRTVLHLDLHNTTGEPLSSGEVLTPVNATGLGSQALIISAAGALVLVIALAPRALRKWARKRARSGQDGPEGPTDSGASDDNRPSSEQPNQTGGSERDPEA